MLRAPGRIIAAALLAATLSCGPTSCGKGPHILYGFLDDQGLWLIAPQYTDALAPSEALVPVQKDDFWGIVDSAGKVVIAPRFDAVPPFIEGLAAVQSQGAWSFIDSSGHVDIAGPFAKAHPFHGGLAAVEIDERWGFVDHGGALAIEPKFDQIGDDLQRDGAIFHLLCFSEGRCAASVEGKLGFIDRSGAWVIPPRYKEAMGFCRGTRRGSRVDRRRHRQGRVRRPLGGWVIEPRFAASLWFSGDRAVAMVEREDVQTEPALDEDEEQHYRTILIDTQGREVADLRWGDEIAGGALEGLLLLASDYLAEGMVPASDGRRWGFMDRDGEWLIPPSFALMFPFKNGLAPAAVSNDPDADFLKFDGWGLIDHGGRWVAEPELKALGPYDGASIPAQLSERWGLLDRDRQWRVLPRYAEDAEWLTLPGMSAAAGEGVYRFGVYANHRWSAVDSRGRRSPVAEYEWLETIVEFPDPRDDGSQRLAHPQEGLWGLADERLMPVVPAQLDAQPHWSGGDNLLHVEQAGRQGCIDASGRWVVPAEFTEVEECGRGEVRAKQDTGWGVWQPGSGWRPLTPGELSTSTEEDYSSWLYLDVDWTWRPTGDDHFRLYHRGKLQGKVPAVD